MAIVRGLLDKLGEGRWFCSAEGRTYMYKDELKALRFEWDPADSVWVRGEISDAEKLKLEKLKVERWFGLFLTFTEIRRKK